DLGRFDLIVIDSNYDLGRFDLIVIDSNYEGALPDAPKILALDAQMRRFGYATTGLIREPPVIRWEFDHPLFRFVSLDDLRISGARATLLPPTGRSLADMPDGPLIFEDEWDGRQVIYFTFHPDQSDLPLRVAFVNLVANIVEWAQPSAASVANTRLTPGEPLPNPDLVSEYRPVETALPVTGSLAPTESVPAAGVYRLTGVEGESDALAVANLFALNETNLGAQTRLGVGASAGWPEAVEVDDFPWWILVCAALGLLCLEWILPMMLGWAERRRFRNQREARARSTASKPVAARGSNA
ncbi:MAG: hypothetical protein KC561_14500, partial [Myxococcales bacterium]|nr:hypothetical protein [Myxococcales bacterium]